MKTGNNPPGKLIKKQNPYQTCNKKNETGARKGADCFAVMFHDAGVACTRSDLRKRMYAGLQGDRDQIRYGTVKTETLR